MRFFALSLMFVPAVAFADMRADFAKCALIKADGTRLVCFDKMGTDLKLDAPKSVTISGNGKWTARTEVSPVDDSKNAFVSLDAEAPVGSGYRRSTPTMFLRCKEKRLEAYITYGNLFIGSESTRVLTRFDKLPAKQSSWGISTDHKAVFVGGSQLGFIKQLMKAESFLVELTPYGESPVMTTFDVRGLSAASKVLQDACPWK